jgi:hypothetical protein
VAQVDNNRYGFKIEGLDEDQFNRIVTLLKRSAYTPSNKLKAYDNDLLETVRKNSSWIELKDRPFYVPPE